MKINSWNIYNNLTYNHLISLRSNIGHPSRSQTRLVNSFITGWRGNIAIFDLFLLRLAFLNFYTILKWGGYRRLTLLLFLKDERFLNLINRNWLKKNINNSSNLLGQIYTNGKWLGGILSNWNSWYLFLKNIEYKEKNKLHVNKKAQRYVRKSRGLLMRQAHPSFPDLIFLVTNENIPKQEAFINYVATSGIADSNVNIKGYSFFIPGNDDSFDFQHFFFKVIQRSIKEGTLLEMEIFFSFFIYYLIKLVK